MNNARTKLNRHAFHGILIVAGIVGALTGSWVVFLVAAMLLEASALHDGSIRLRPGKRR